MQEVTDEIKRVIIDFLNDKRSYIHYFDKEKLIIDKVGVEYTDIQINLHGLVKVEREYYQLNDINILGRIVNLYYKYNNQNLASINKFSIFRKIINELNPIKIGDFVSNCQTNGTPIKVDIDNLNRIKREPYIIQLSRR